VSQPRASAGVQAAVIESSDPLQVLSRLELTVEQMSLQLTDAEGTISTLSASVLRCALRTYQAMLSAKCSIGAAGVTGPSSDLIRTGALPGDDVQFLHVDYTSKPHDSDVDHAVKVRMAPAYVTYDLTILERFRACAQLDVTGDGSLDLTALGAQAATRLQEMQVRGAICALLSIWFILRRQSMYRACSCACTFHMIRLL
jgi:hypothetical protein